MPTSGTSRPAPRRPSSTAPLFGLRLHRAKGEENTHDVQSRCLSRLRVGRASPRSLAGALLRLRLRPEEGHVLDPPPDKGFAAGRARLPVRPPRDAPPPGRCARMSGLRRGGRAARSREEGVRGARKGRGERPSERRRHRATGKSSAGNDFRWCLGTAIKSRLRAAPYPCFCRRRRCEVESQNPTGGGGRRGSCRNQSASSRGPRRTRKKKCGW
jgi:hypothetical protein